MSSVSKICPSFLVFARIMFEAGSRPFNLIWLSMAYCQVSVGRRCIRPNSSHMIGWKSFIFKEDLGPLSTRLVERSEHGMQVPRQRSTNSDFALLGACRKGREPCQRRRWYAHFGPTYDPSHAFNHMIVNADPRSAIGMIEMTMDGSKEGGSGLQYLAHLASYSAHLSDHTSNS